ncbi:unnamed protein product [Urochloa decumbens]|uniref:UBC core domain-containing protein n=1 Tax=Urochloa decumbens TaxID=240449 RepID=A0ABC9F635_9POAL
MASGGVARGRLAEERKSWRKSHPHVRATATWVRGVAGDAAGWDRQPYGLEVHHPRQGRQNDVLNFVQQNTTSSSNKTLWHLKETDLIYTDWEGGYFPVTLHFTENYPSNPPTCKFPARFFHVNVFDSGEVCLSILGDAWKPSITMRQILIGIQDLLNNPNPASPAQDLAYDLFAENTPEYRKHVRQQAKRYPSLV